MFLLEPRDLFDDPVDLAFCPACEDDPAPCLLGGSESTRKDRGCLPETAHRPCYQGLPASGGVIDALGEFPLPRSKGRIREPVLEVHTMEVSSGILGALHIAMSEIYLRS